MNVYMAKRLVRALATVVERHEERFGALETDVRKRAISRRVPQRPPEQSV